jgi:hypothetical protein
MSGRNPYANGYGYPPDHSRGGNGGGYGSSDSHGVNGYGAAAGGGRDRERRPGGYGGFYNDETQPLAAGSSPGSRGRDADREREYGRGRPDWDRGPTTSSSRSRPRDGNAPPPRRRGEPGDGDYLRPTQPSRPEMSQPSRSEGVSGGRAPQSIEGRFCILDEMGSYSNTLVKIFCRKFNAIGTLWHLMTVLPCK